MFCVVSCRQFQRFAGLTPTGLMDRDTKRKMLAPRCGFPDVVKPKDRKPSGRRNQPSRLEAGPLGFSALGRNTFSYTNMTPENIQSNLVMSISDNRYCSIRRQTPRKLNQTRPNNMLQLSQTNGRTAALLYVHV